MFVIQFASVSIEWYICAVYIGSYAMYPMVSCWSIDDACFILIYEVWGA